MSLPGWCDYCALSTFAETAARRAKILRQYAQHLSDAELLALAHATPGMAGRDLRDVCEQAERHWASKVQWQAT